MSSDLSELLKWVPAGTAEGEKQIAERVFVYVDQFASVMAPPVGSPRLLIGTKGSGKSAVIDFALRILNQQSIPSILLTPFDLDASHLPEGSSTGDMVRIFYSMLMTAIAGKLAESATGWFDGNRATLYQEAVKAGERSADFYGRMGKFLAEVSKAITKVDFNAAFPHLTSVTKKELEAAIERSLNQKSVYLFLDDTDQIASPDKPGHLNRVWALMLAVRRLTSNIPEARCIISLRSEVWERLQVDPLGQRDQTDHFKTLCITLKSNRDHVGAIIDRRLALAADAVGRPGDVYAPFFEGASAKAPNSDALRSWRDLITVRSRERPRDAIQLINGLATRAMSNREAIISQATFQAFMPTFSEGIAREFARLQTQSAA